MGLNNRISLLADILRTVEGGKNSIELVVDLLSQRPFVLRTDILGLVPLAIKFGFLIDQDKKLNITQTGRDFMNYVDSTSEEISSISNPTEKNYPTLDKTLKEIAEKYKTKDDDVYDDMNEIRQQVSKSISFAPEMSEDYETLLTITMPISSEEKIPPELRGQVMFHEGAVEKVIQNTSGEFLVSTYTLDVPVFMNFVKNINTKRLNCKLILGDAEKIKDEKTNFQLSLNALKKFMDVHFDKYEIRLVRELQKGFVSHAKIWLSEKAVVITSANVTINSTSDNFEAGIYTTRKDIIRSCEQMMKKVWDLGVTL